jgi:hypothetical protein
MTNNPDRVHLGSNLPIVGAPPETREWSLATDRLRAGGHDCRWPAGERPHLQPDGISLDPHPRGIAERHFDVPIGFEVGVDVDIAPDE